MNPEERAQLIDRFLVAERRERHRLLRDLAPHLERDDVVRLAPALRDPSPKTSARIVSLLAQHGLEDLLEELLVGLKPGKIDILRAHYQRQRP